MKNAVLIGIPLDLGAENLGVDVGPNAFRYNGIVEKLNKSGLVVTDYGNIHCKDRGKLTIGNPRLRYLDEILQVSEKSAKMVHKVITNKEKAIVLGGDHSITLGTVSGASVAFNGDLGLIYFDAHGDINTDKTTLTGNIHGMHLASLVGFGNKKLRSVYTSKVKISKENLIHIGGSDFDQPEIDLIEKENLKFFRIIDILSYGFLPVLNAILELQSRVKNIWISMDLDSIDSIYAPGAGMPNRTGLSYREITTLAEYIGRNCKVIGVDVVEFNPLNDIENKTAEIGTELIAKFLGHNYSWYSDYMNKNKL